MKRLILLLAMLTACASVPQQTQDDVQPTVSVYVENQVQGEARVFVYGKGVYFLLNTFPGNSQPRTPYVVARDKFPDNGCFRVFVRLTGNGNRGTSDETCLNGRLAQTAYVTITRQQIWLWSR